ncbi:response regulator transcription factor [Novosphingobium sp. KN65.2]|uniref:response regulator transcription factor n=1 Tax=Novosphingobium sp. KN65.2 TaxID=1478134 RepID=UPI0005E1C9FA|nr:response regulator transcription factor [Novosphingobium sp. KN65.2]CDO38331.1 putative Two-component transcriptional regulator; putative transcriptional regulator involved in heavy-metal (Cu/Zn) homeostasis [Novosphingobium sp. KN65.2]
MRILLAEDDVDNVQFVANGLREHGHIVLLAETGTDALHFGLTETLDLFIMDRMLPQLDGLSVLRRLRAAQIKVPAIMLTALGRIEDRIEGLDAGADDYLVKPFAFGELLARVNALSRRASPQEVVTKLSAGPVEMDLLRREVRRDGMIILLQPREFRVLEELMRHPGEFVTRTMLLERVWDFHFDPQTKIVETHMSRLRSKLNEGGLPDVIETVRGVGYRVRVP